MITLFDLIRKPLNRQQYPLIAAILTLFFLIFGSISVHGQSLLERTSETPTGALLTDSCQPALSEENLYREMDSGLLFWIAEDCPILPENEVSLNEAEIKDYEDFVLNLLKVNPKIDGVELVHDENTKIIIKRQGPS